MLREMQKRWVLAIVLASSLAWFAGAGKLSSCWRRSAAELFAASSGTHEVRFYVSAAGNDAWSGKLDRPNPQNTDGPFRTLARARNAVRALKSAGRLKRPVTVYIREGIYRLAAPLIFNPQDSGEPASPVTYSAYPGERPVLSGGMEITGWRHYTGTEFPARVRSQLWVARVPEAQSASVYFHQLFVNGRRRPRARKPNAGFFHVDGFITSGSPATFHFYQGDIRPEWAQQDDVEVIALQAWAELRMPIRAVDEATRTVTLAGRRQPSNVEKYARYWVENAADGLDAPGEWYFDRKNGSVYYYPLPGEEMSRAHVVASRLQQLIRLQGDPRTGQYVHDIRLRGLRFICTDWKLPAAGYADIQAAYDIPAAVYGSGTRRCTIEVCLFTHLGGYAIELSHGSKQDQICHNEMTDLGAGGVKIGDPKVPSDPGGQTGGITVADNHIHDIGKVYPAAVGVWIGQSGRNIIAHNEINDAFYTAISAGWTWGYGPTAANHNLIEFNNLHNIGRGMLSDMGCIYTLGVQPGTIERNNVCRDVTRYSYGGWGIYLDEGSSDIAVQDNLVYRTEDGGIHQHYGKSNIIRNNIFALGSSAQLRRSREEPHLSFTFEHNIVYWNNNNLLDGKWDDNNFRFDYNLYYRVGGGPVQFSKWPLKAWQQRGQDQHSIVAPPLFLDPEQGHFSLDPASPAFTIGFKPIDVSRAGPRK